MSRRGVLLMLAACSGLLLGAAYVAHPGPLRLMLIALGGMSLIPCVLPVVRSLVSRAAGIILAARTRPDPAVRRDLASGHPRITGDADSEKESMPRTGGPPPREQP